MELPQYEPITTLEQLGELQGVPFFGSFRGSGEFVDPSAGRCPSGADAVSRPFVVRGGDLRVAVY